MGTDRRGFLQIGGLAALGLVVAKPAVDIFSSLSNSDNSDATSSAAAGADIKQYAMVVDINTCKTGIEGGCGYRCQTACHLWHNVPDIDSEEEIKWIWPDTYGRVFEENLKEHIDEEDEEKKSLPVILLCNQCTHPPCIRYCPTRATWKRESDGIVMVDFHRCIGCRYCMAGCPYGARSFNWRNPRNNIHYPTNPEYPTRTRGVVEKCNFCADRLDKFDDFGNHLIPRCVEVCPVGALSFGDLIDEDDPIHDVIADKQLFRRMPELGTKPNNYYFLA